MYIYPKNISLHQHDVAVSFLKSLPLHQHDIAIFFHKNDLSPHVEVACLFLRNRMTQPVLLSFGRQIFEPIFTKAEKIVNGMEILISIKGCVQTVT